MCVCIFWWTSWAGLGLSNFGRLALNLTGFSILVPAQSHRACNFVKALYFSGFLLAGTGRAWAGLAFLTSLHMSASSASHSSPYVPYFQPLQLPSSPSNYANRITDGPTVYHWGGLSGPNDITNSHAFFLQLISLTTAGIIILPYLLQPAAASMVLISLQFPRQCWGSQCLILMVSQEQELSHTRFFSVMGEFSSYFAKKITNATFRMHSFA